jgi:hypothetical protein
MKTRYIQFEEPESEIPKKGWLVRILTKILPPANPDFEDKIFEVRHWLLELDSETGIPVREIGLDKEGQVIVKMPFKKNYGYWTDSNISFDESAWQSNLSKETFEENWALQ